MRELIISLYLMGFKGLFTGFKRFPLKNKVTFLVSFPENPLAVYQMLKRKKINVEIVFLCHARCFDQLKKVNKFTYLVESRRMIHTIIGIYHLATSKQVIVDNYYGFLAVTDFKAGVKCTQIWHAVGAIKQFGAKDPSNVNRTPGALKRFKQVFSRFDYIVVGSDFMGDIFKIAFLAKDEALLKTGVPRTDFFFDVKKHQEVRASLYKAHSLFANKKVILYAPTFRKDEADASQIHLDIQKMYVALKAEYVLLIKFHPAITCGLNLSSKYEDFIFDYSSYGSMNELLLITDILITDYASIPTEFVLLKRKMIFFAYDLEEYKQKNGLWEDYESLIPGPVVKNTEDVIAAVLNQEINLQQLEAYAKKWTAYCDGHASEKLVNVLFRN